MAYKKDPGDVKDYAIDWSQHLLVEGEDAGDTITASTWVVAAGLTKDSDFDTTTRTTVWLSGGTAGVEYLVTNHVTTAQGRQFERSFTVNVTQL